MTDPPPNPLPPGNLAYPLLGSIRPTLTFLRSPPDFLHTQTLRHGPLFKTRILNTPTIITASYSTTHALLCGEHNFLPGYHDFLGGLYPGPNLLMDGEGDEGFQGLLGMFGSVMGKNFVGRYLEIVREIVGREVAGLEEGVLGVYGFWKRVMGLVMRRLVFGAEVLDKGVERDVGLVWKGMCSVPVDVGVRGWWRSGFGKGVEAGERLYKHFIGVVDGVLGDGVSGINGGRDMMEGTIIGKLIEMLPENPSEKHKHALSCHLILLSSSLIPKTMASLLATLTYYRPSYKNDPLPHLILESLRLKPPLLGGLRSTHPTASNTPLSNYTIPPNYRVWYSALSANHDPSKYPNPKTFNPQRWSKSINDPSSLHNQCPFRTKCTPPIAPNDQDINPYHMAFGAGERMCLGRDFAVRCAKIAMTIFEQEFEWNCENIKDVEWRWMPVLRPVDGLKVFIKRKKNRNRSVDGLKVFIKRKKNRNRSLTIST